jgi:hypothetical protein
MGRVVRLESAEMQSRHTGRWLAHDVNAPLMVLWGPSGGGSSAGIEMILYALGLRGELVGFFLQEHQAVRVRVKVGTRRILATRMVNRRPAPTVTFTDLDTRQESLLPVSGPADAESAATYLMDLLGLPRAELPGKDAKLLTPDHLSALFYLRQSQIDSTWLGLARGSAPGPAELLALQVVLGLYDPALAQLKRERSKATGSRNKQTSRMNILLEHYREHGLPDEPALLDQQRQLAEDLRGAESDLTSRQEALQEATREREALVAAAGEPAERLRKARADHEVAQKLHSEHQRTLDRLRRELADLGNGPRHREACPDCLASLARPGVTVAPGVCRTCLQPDERAEERARQRQARRAEHLRLVDAAEGALQVAARELQRALNAASTAMDDHLAHQTRLTTHTEQVYLPARAAHTTALQRRDRLKGLLERVSKDLPAARELKALQEETTRLKKLIDDLDKNIALAKDQNQVRSKEITLAWSDHFRETLAALGHPHDTARIVPDTFEPEVNGEDFRAQALAGGVLTVINLAWHLSLLALSRSDARILMPGWMLIDSPHEGVGTTGADQDTAQRIAQVLAQATTPDSDGTGSQLVVCADAELLPAGQGSRHLYIDREQPFGLRDQAS